MSIQTIHRLEMFLKTLQTEKHPDDSCGEGPCSWCWFESLIPKMKTEVERLETELTEAREKQTTAIEIAVLEKFGQEASRKQVTALREEFAQAGILHHHEHSGSYAYREICLNKVCQFIRTALASTAPAKEPQFNEAGFSKHGCHYGTIYTRVVANDEVYDSESCPQCEQGGSQQPETQTACPCDCHNKLNFYAHFEDCSVDCSGTLTSVTEETDNG